ncbi:MAG: restriction endonuclease subunit S [Coxiellaceae bacterium]|nr:MAG: restriction endonuclease subunit S [Coxiellaceae bacterium]
MFCVRGSTTGKMNWSDQTYAIGRGIAAIRGKNGYPNSFIRAVIEFKLENLLTQATGSTFPNVGRDLLNELKIPFISAKSAQMIAAILEPIDDRINLLRETNNVLESIPQALFKSWFIDFDPVHAKAEGCQPEGMDAEVVALFPDSFEESELGLIPRGWLVRQVSEVADIIKGKSYSSKDLVDVSSTALVTLKSFARGGGFRLDGFKPYAGGFKSTQVVVPGDLIVAYTDVTQAAELIGKPAIVIGLQEFSTLVASLDIGIIKPRLELISRQYLYGLFKTDSFQSHTLAHTSGTTVLHLSKEAVGSYLFVCPDPKIIAAFTTIASEIANRIQVSIDEIQTLTVLRNTLLPRLISGQLQIPIDATNSELVT